MATALMEQIRAYVAPSPPPVVLGGRLVERLAARAAELTGQRASHIMAHDPHAEPTLARFAVYLVAREKGKSYPQIGRAMNRDHSTVIYGCRRAAEIEKTDEEFATLLRLLRVEAGL